jgi:hypothetical protein
MSVNVVSIYQYPHRFLTIQGLESDIVGRLFLDLQKQGAGVSVGGAVGLGDLLSVRPYHAVSCGNFLGVAR